MKQRGFIFAPMLLSALPYILGAAALLGVVWGIHHHGYTSGAQSVQTKWDQAVEALRLEEQTQAGNAATKLETGNAKARVIFKTITQTVDKIVTRDVYRNVCIEPDGMQLVNAALSGTLPASAKPDTALPSSDPATGRHGGFGLTEARGDGRAVLRVR